APLSLTEGGTPTSARPTARGWLLRSPSEAGVPGDEIETDVLDEGPVVQPYPNADSCERAREEQLSAALRVAKATDADSEAEVSPGVAADARGERRPLRAGAVRGPGV